MYLLTAPIDKNGHILAGIYFVFLKKIFWTKRESLWIPNFNINGKIVKVLKY